MCAMFVGAHETAACVTNCVFDIFVNQSKAPRVRALFSSGHFPHFENVPIAAGHCKQLTRRNCTGPTVELLKFCKKDTMSITTRLLQGWNPTKRHRSNGECPAGSSWTKKMKENALQSSNIFEHSLQTSFVSCQELHSDE